jgi:hypothetical protein
MFCNKEYLQPATGTMRYAQTVNRLGAYLAGVPRLQYEITSRLLLDLNVVVNLLHLEGTFERNADPTLPPNAQTSNEWELMIPEWEVFTIRLGAGIRI